MRGTLILVVGPSGAGKDSLIAATRARLATDTGCVFVQRHITRPADPQGEGHIPLADEEFCELKNANRFLMSWEAHGLRYGIHRDYENHLARGQTVVANVSRLTIKDACAKFSPVSVVHVTAPPELLKQRLEKRGREGSKDQSARLRRSAELNLVSDNMIEICNDGTLAEAVKKFTTYILNVSRQSRAS